MIHPRLGREAYDRARNPALADRLVATLPKRPTTLLLGAAGWPLLCWLAPRIRRAQVWRIIDSDANGIDEAMEEIARAAEDRGLVVTWPKRAMLVHVPGGAWRVEGIVAPAGPALLRLGDAAVAEGLPALLSSGWSEVLATSAHGGFLATLNKIGSPRFLPVRPAVRLPGDDHGRSAAVALARFAGALRRRGDAVQVAVSDVRLRGANAAPQLAWIDAWLMQARATAPRSAPRTSEWADERIRQAIRGHLEVRLPCRDLLALPR